MCQETPLKPVGLRQRAAEKQRPSAGDAAAGGCGTRRHVTLSAPGMLPYLCSQVPGLCMISLLALLALAAWQSSAHFFLLTAALGFYVAIWTVNMAFSSAIGAYKMRAATGEDWDAKLKELQQRSPDDTEVMHIVILPNYKENEHMLQETLENLGRSSVARSQLHVVLAMEAREGPVAYQKADSLVKNTSHLFARITASFHPAGLPAETPGKSSNTQWAFKEALRTFAPQLSRMDPSRVFISVGDADVLWHPHFFSALAYQGLCMTESERSWTMWQPPVLLTRNLFSVPGPIRVSGLGTLLFELSGLANQCFGTHVTFSTYSMTLSLASHPEVDGWDVDVIAEDHHMFCKCYFASLWESAGSMPDVRGKHHKDVVIEPKLQLQPVWLPTVAYLAESSAGYIASLHERFVQAKRHSYGVVELGYVMLQYIKLMCAAGPMNLPLKTHVGILSIAWKMHTVHIMNTVQACSLMITGMVTVPSMVSWLWNGGAEAVMAGGFVMRFDTVRWALCAAFGPLPPVAIISACTMFLVIMDLMEGRYALPPPTKANDVEPCRSRQESSSMKVQASARLSWLQRIMLCGKMQHDMMCLAEPTVMVYGMVPELIAVWTLFRQNKFEYIAGAKPVGAA